MSSFFFREGGPLAWGVHWHAGWGGSQGEESLGAASRDGSNWCGGCPSLPPPLCDEASRYASQKTPVTD